MNVKGERIPAYIFLSMYNSRINLHKEFLEAITEMGEEYEVGILKSKLAYRNAYKVSTIQGMSALEWDDKKAIDEVQAFGKEVEKILKAYE